MVQLRARMQPKRLCPALLREWRDLGAGKTQLTSTKKVLLWYWKTTENHRAWQPCAGGTSTSPEALCSTWLRGGILPSQHIAAICGRGDDLCKTIHTKSKFTSLHPTYSLRRHWCSFLCSEQAWSQTQQNYPITCPPLGGILCTLSTLSLLPPNSRGSSKDGSLQLSALPLHFEHSLQAILQVTISPPASMSCHGGAGGVEEKAKPKTPPRHYTKTPWCHSSAKRLRSSRSIVLGWDLLPSHWPSWLSAGWPQPPPLWVYRSPRSNCSCPCWGGQWCRQWKQN